MSKEGDRIREQIEIERDLKSAPIKDVERVYTVEFMPIEFNIFVGNKAPTREEVGRAIIQEIENDTFYYKEVIKHVKQDEDWSAPTRTGNRIYIRNKWLKRAADFEIDLADEEYIEIFKKYGKQVKDGTYDSCESELFIYPNIIHDRVSSDE